MQIWPLLDAGLQRARQIHETTFLYDDKTTLLVDLLDARNAINDEFDLDAETRNYWTIRNALTDLIAAAAVYAADAHHGQDPTLNPTPAIALHTAGDHATDQDDPDHPYAHWEDFRTDLDIIRNALDTAIDPNPNLRDPETILELLADNAGKAALFAARARLGIHDKDPHAQTNFAVIQWQDPDWTVLANYCDYGYVPDIPAQPGDFPDETRCLPCVLPEGLRSFIPTAAAPQLDPLPKTLPAVPYHARPRLTRAAGIVTGAKAVHWPMLAAIALSTNQHALPLAIADHGLTDAQRRHLKAFAVLWINAPEPTIPKVLPPHHAIAEPRAWTKPWTCLASPFERSLWIDSDAVPLFRNLDPLHLHAESFLIATDHPWNPHAAGMYHALNAACPNLNTTGKPNPAAPACNTGIMAWTKGEPILTSWRNHAAMLLAHPNLLHLCGVRDQSAMWLTLRDHEANTGRKPQFLDDTWNWPADDLPAPQSANRRPIPLDPRKLLETTRQRHPNANVVHWLGRPKPQQLYQPE